MIDSDKCLNEIQICSTEYAYLLEGAPITAKQFKVRIPKLMPELPAGSAQNGTISINKSLFVNDGACKVPMGGSVSTRNYIIAKSKCDYETVHKGEIVNSSVKGITEPGGPGPHTHDVLQPLSMSEVVFSGLNDKEAAIGTRVIGVFVGKNINDFWVEHIEGAIE